MFARTFRPLATRVIQTQRRQFGSSAPVEYTGIEATVRGVLPKDEHLVMGILGLYGVLIGVGKAMSGGGKKEEKETVAVEAPSGGDIPSVESESFGSFIESESNLNKLIASWEK